MVRVARRPHLMTTTGELIAEKYRRAGIERVEMIGNHVPQAPSGPAAATTVS